MNTLLTNMAAALTTALTAYPATVVSREWDPDKLPDFDRYGVVLSAGQESDDPCGVTGILRTLPVRVVCLVRVTGSGDQAAVLSLADSVKAALRNSTLSAAVIADNNPFSGATAPGRAGPNLPQVLAVIIDYSGRRKVQVIT